MNEIMENTFIHGLIFLSAYFIIFIYKIIENTLIYGLIFLSAYFITFITI